MIKGHAYMQDEHVYIHYEGQDQKELITMKGSVKELGRDAVTFVEDSKSAFKIRIDKKDREMVKKIIDLAGYKDKIRSRTKVEKDLYDYLRLKWS